VQCKERNLGRCSATCSSMTPISKMEAGCHYKVAPMHRILLNPAISDVHCHVISTLLLSREIEHPENLVVVVFCQFEQTSMPGRSQTGIHRRQGVRGCSGQKAQPRLIMPKTRSPGQHDSRCSTRGTQHGPKWEMRQEAKTRQPNSKTQLRTAYRQAMGNLRGGNATNSVSLSPVPSRLSDALRLSHAHAQR
jgi:hypothetical protein